MRSVLAALLGTALAAAAAAQAPAQPQHSVQQQFDASAAALIAENWPEALRLLESLETRLLRVGGRNLAIVRVRKAQALLELGRDEEAVDALRVGLPDLTVSDRSLDEDRFTGHITLGRLAERRFDHAAARGHYRIAAGVDLPLGSKSAAVGGLIRTQMFFDAPAALRDVDEALRVAAAAAPADRSLEGEYRTLRGRVLLNMGRFAEARQELDRATRMLGGLTRRVDLRDLIARSDLAVAAALAGDQEAARRYLAYTGAGRMRNAFVPSLSPILVPRCGDGIAPEDVAVVEFSVRENGTVAHATPVYSSKQGEAALLFARTVTRWAWAPEEVRRIHPLFRSAVRVELRCSQRALAYGELPPDQIAEIARWSSARGIALEPEPARGRAAADLRAELAGLEARHGSSAPQLLIPLMRLGTALDLSDRDRIPVLERALRIAAASAVPDAYLTQVAFWLNAARRGAADADFDEAPNHPALLVDPALRGNPHVAAALHIAEARWLAERQRWDAAQQQLDRARALALPPGHALMPRLLEATALIENGRGNDAAAQEAWRAIPPDRRWCLFSPRRRTIILGDHSFPREAQNWGFEGWTTVESLVGRGRAAHRVVAAYPPFVFDEGSLEIARTMRFETTFEPESGPCAVSQQGFSFQLP